jgi:hypothetical protein
MSETPEFLSDRLHAEGTRVVEFFKTLSVDQWSIIVYLQESQWTFHDLLAHFVASEIGRQKLIIDVVNGGKGAALDFDIDRFNQRQVNRYSNESNSELLIIFSAERNCLIDIVSGLKQADLDRIGNDPFLGEVTVSEMIKLTYRHLQIHIRDARRCL